MNAIPVIGWIIDLASKISLSVPFWIVWMLCGIGAKYFYWLPDIYLRPGFWDCVGVFICLGVLGAFSPLRVASASTSEAKGS